MVSGQPPSPATKDYLRGLPGGAASHPSCTVHSEVFGGVVRKLDEVLAATPWPDDLQPLRPGEGSTWLPEVHMQLLSLFLADQMGEDAYLEWVYEDSSRIYQRPVFRHLMKLVSPTLMVMGASSRWSAMHRGTVLTASPVSREGERITTMGKLVTPPGLFPPLYARALCLGFKAAIDGARGTEVRVELATTEPTLLEFRVSWAR